MLLSRISSITFSRVIPRHNFQRHVSSLPPLTAAFNTKQSVQFRFNWLQNKTGLFGIQELKNSHGWAELRDRCFINCDELVREVTSDQRSGLCPVSHQSPQHVIISGIEMLLLSSMTSAMNCAELPTWQSLSGSLTQVV